MSTYSQSTWIGANTETEKETREERERVREDQYISIYNSKY